MAAASDTSRESMLRHRYEREHEKALYAAIRQLLALERSGADLPEPEPEPEPVPQAEAVAAPPAPEAAEKLDSNIIAENTCGKLASVGAAAPAGVPSGRLEGSPGHPGRPTGADPGTKTAPRRR